MLDLRFFPVPIDSLLPLLSTNFVLIWSFSGDDSVPIPDLTFGDLLKSTNFIICSFLGFSDSLAKRMVFSEFVVQNTWRDRS